MKLGPRIFPLCFLTLLAGCGSGESWKSSTNLVGRGWASPPDPYQPSPLYCYKTIGGVQCHEQRLASSEDNRLEGFYGPAPLETPSEGFFSSFIQGDDPEPINVEPLPAMAPIMKKPCPVPKTPLRLKK